MSDDDDAEVIEIPYTSLQPTTLRAVVEEFVTRDTTDYGVRIRTLDEKVDDVMRQLRRGEARIAFHPGTSSVNIVTARKLRMK